jgi:hypothetical protein
MARGGPLGAFGCSNEPKKMGARIAPNSTSLQYNYRPNVICS